MIKNKLTSGVQEKIIRLRPDDYKGLSEIYSKSEVKEVKYLKSGIRVKIKAEDKNIEYLDKKN